VCENAKTTRAFLKRVDAVCPPRAAAPADRDRRIAASAQGRPGHATFEGDRLLAPRSPASDLGLISEAGLPAVADPGAQLVAAAHDAGIRVVALPGASSITLAVAASGLNGQSFAFVGYLPTEADARAVRIRELEATSRRLAQTQVMIETPYRNAALLGALLAQLQPATMLSVSVGLTLAGESTRSDRIERWRAGPATLPADVPAVFSLLAR
jgi:16S rRNA (cytidine1402-2'-O)-methyltransferase